MLNEVAKQDTFHGIKMGARATCSVGQVEAVVDANEEETEEDVDQEADGDPAEGIISELGQTEVDSEGEEDKDVRDEDKTRIDGIIFNILQIPLSVADRVGRLDVFV